MKLFLIFILIGITVQLPAQDRYPGVLFGNPIPIDTNANRKPAVPIYNFDYFSVEDGLVESQVYSALEDSRGFMWFGTYGGVSVYDGTGFVNYTTTQGLPNDIVYSICEDKKGNIWMGTENGACKFDGKNFTSFYTENGLLSNVVKKVYCDSRNNIWLGTDLGVVCFREKDTISFSGKSLAGTQVNSILELENNRYCFGTSKGLTFFDGTNLMNVYDSKSFLDTTVWSLYMVKDTLWIGTSVGPVYLENNRYHSLSQELNMAFDRISDFREDQEGNLWMASYGKGLFKYNNHTVVSINQNNGLDDNSIFGMGSDSKGHLWVGNMTGLRRFDGEKFTHYSKQSGLINDVVFATLKDKKSNVWVGTIGGLSCLRNNHFFTLTPETGGLSGLSVYITFEDKDGNIWVGTDNGPQLIKNDRLYSFTGSEQLKRDVILSIIQDHEDNIWFGTYKGAYKYDGKDLLLISEKEGLIHNTVFDIFQDSRHNFWIASEDGISFFDRFRVTAFKAEKAFNGSYVFAILEDLHQNIWLGVYGQGLIGIKKNNYEKFLKELYGHPYDSAHPVNLPEYVIINEAAGMTDVGIYQLVLDKNGFIWAGGNRGINRIDPKILEHPEKSGFVKKYTAKTGFMGVETNHEASSCDKDNNLWIGCAARLTKINLSLDKEYNKELPTHLKSVSLFYQSVDWTKGDHGGTFSGQTSWFGLPKDLILPYNSNHLTFDFVGISTDNPTEVLYQWKLEPLEEDWSPVNDKTSATYSNIPPGNYTFCLRSRSPEGVWLTDPVTYAFTITPPWWATWWAYLLYLTSTVFISIGFFKWRTAALKKRQLELAEEVRRKTKEVVKERDEAEKQKQLAEEQRNIAENQKEIIAEQKLEVEAKNRMIIDSITYAQRIQSAILPNLDWVDKQFRESFVFYRPKDIVAGDFYWMEVVDDEIYIAAADCTGHGVPGAMLSVVCSNALTRCVKELGIKRPGEILDMASEIIEKRLSNREDVEDGMDIALCRINLKKKMVQFSGAHNPLWIYSGLQKDEVIIHELKGDWRCVGKFWNKTPFSTQELQLEEGDTLYMYSDGYIDQYGGPRTKKYMSTNFKDLLKEIQSESLSEQKTILNDTIIAWMGKQEQIDDICVIGIRI